MYHTCITYLIVRVYRKSMIAVQKGAHATSIDEAEDRFEICPLPVAHPNREPL
jgi:hypothetical protein